MSAGQAASKGTWTIIGPGVQCIMQDQHAASVREALTNSNVIPLKKSNGVYWLPAKICPGGSPAANTMGSAGGPATMTAVKAVKNAVPVDDEMELDPAEETEPTNLPSSSLGPELPALGDPPLEESEVERQPVRKRIPETVSAEEDNQHMLTHIPYRSWCDHCVSGKAREDPHKRREPLDKQAIPRMSLDYCFLGRMLASAGARPVADSSAEPSAETLRTPQDEDDGTVPILIIHDERSGVVFAGVTRKGVDAYSINLVTEALKFCGRTKTIRSLAEAAAKEWSHEVQIMTTPRESHASNGLAEGAILEVSRQTRTLVNAVELRYPNTKITVMSQLYTWIVRHAAWLISRYLVKSDGKTPYERLRGREFKGQIVEPLEVVHYKLEKTKTGKLDAQTAVGVWIGKSLNSDEHYVGTAEGIRRCRSTFRRPEKKRWDEKILQAMKGVPWQPRGTGTVVPGAPVPGQGVAAPGTPGVVEDTKGKRSVYITLDRRRFRRRLWCRARSGSTGFKRRFRRRFQEALVQSQVRFNGVPGKVPEKVWEALVQSEVRLNRVPEKVVEKVWKALVQS